MPKYPSLSINDLLDEFVAVAAGERTPMTKARYQSLVEPLRDFPGFEGVGVACLLNRVTSCLKTMDGEVASPIISLWRRLVNWLRRFADLTDEETRTAFMCAHTALHRLERQRYRNRHPEVVRPAPKDSRLS
ncbi:MAG: hypothetical protein ACRCTR_02250 [Actinomycetota bacterium]